MSLDDTSIEKWTNYNIFRTYSLIQTSLQVLSQVKYFVVYISYQTNLKMKTRYIIPILLLLFAVPIVYLSMIIFKYVFPQEPDNSAIQQNTNNIELNKDSNVTLPHWLFLLLISLCPPVILCVVLVYVSFMQVILYILTYNVLL